MSDIENNTGADGEVSVNAMPASPHAASPHTIDYVGQWQDLIGLSIKNAFLNLITLSLYRFWGRTEVRQHIWNNIHIDGDPLIYSGTGGELFKGFLMAILVFFIPLGLLSYTLNYLILSEPMIGGIATLVLYIYLITLSYFGLYMAMRYRLSRTEWRGIRMAQAGDAKTYAKKGLGYTLLAFITLSFATPFLENQLFKYESQNRFFGSNAFHYDQPTGRLFGAYILSLIAFIMIVLCGSFLLGVAVGMFAGTAGRALESGSFTFILLIYLILIFAGAFAFSIYQAKKLTLWINNTSLSSVTLKGKISLISYAGLTLSNTVIIIFSLGILTPIAQMRGIKFLIDRITVEGTLDLEEMAQTTHQGPKTGEGIAEGFDMGTV